MLNIYYGRENLNKDLFMYQKIREHGSGAYIIVPDQFKLTAERAAIDALGAEGLMDIEVIDMGKLAERAAKAAGRSPQVVIDRRGRSMIIARAMMEISDDLVMYKGAENKSTFIDMANDFIMETKQHGMTPEEMGRISEQLDDRILSQKMQDLTLLFGKYEELLKEKHIDNADVMNYLISDIPSYSALADKEIWISGYDYFSPQQIRLIISLAEYCPSVNLMLTGDSAEEYSDIFGITMQMIRMISTRASEAGLKFSAEQIDDGYIRTDVAPALKAVEQNLFSLYPGRSSIAEGITFVNSANPYSEAESAALFIRYLIREKGFKYSDIAVVANDLEERGTILHRVFSGYDIPAFVDRKRNVLGNFITVFLLAAIDAISGSMDTAAILRMLKTGLGPVDPEHVELLEDYVIKYKIRGRRWRDSFTYGQDDYKDHPGRFGEIEETRKNVVDMLESFEALFKSGRKIANRVDAIFRFAVEIADLPSKAEAEIERFKEQSMYERAQESQQVWDAFVNVLEQMKDLMGSRSVSMKDFRQILLQGLASVEIGILPPSVDGLVIGNIQRTRRGRCRAVVITGANEGVLPSGKGAGGLISEDEKKALARKDMQFFKLEELQRKEENLGVYKALASASDELWISTCLSGSDDSQAMPSRVFTDLREIFPSVIPEKDITGSDNVLDHIGSIGSTAEHMAIAAREDLIRSMTGRGSTGIPASAGPTAEGVGTGNLSDSGSTFRKERSERQGDASGWQQVWQWYLDNAPEYAAKIHEGISFSNRAERIGKDNAAKIYGYDPEKGLSLSPSRIEKFGRCPFSHFVSYGLHPEERRIFEAAPREIGDIYHHVMMRFSDKLTEGVREAGSTDAKRMDITDPDSLWMNISREEAFDIADEILLEESRNYREGLLDSSHEEQFKGERLREICREICWILVKQVRAGQISDMKFEAAFRRGGSIPPVELALPDDMPGRVYVEGTVDRMDILPDGSIKVIDYKTGRDKFRMDEAKAGWKVQLVLYMAASRNYEPGDRKPAGVFYFSIKEPVIEADKIASDSMTREEFEAEISKKIESSFKLDGVAIDEPEVVKYIGGDAKGGNVISATNREGSQKRLLSREEFEEFQQAVIDGVTDICRKIVIGDIDIRPKRTKDMTACTYCQYNGICRFDTSFSECRYENI